METKPVFITQPTYGSLLAALMMSEGSLISDVPKTLSLAV